MSRFKHAVQALLKPWGQAIPNSAVTEGKLEVCRLNDGKALAKY